MLSLGKLVELILMTFSTDSLIRHLDQMNSFFAFVLGAVAGRTANIIFAVLACLPVLDQKRGNTLMTAKTRVFFGR